MRDQALVVVPVTLAFALLMVPLGRMLLTGKGVKLHWVLLVSAFFLVVVYAASEKNRIWSYHGMMHGGIAQQIINGEIPPTNPYLAGEPLYFPWGHHLLAAGVCMVLPVTTAWAFAAVNTVSLLLIIRLVAAIARQVINDERASVLAAYVAVLGTTIFDGHIMTWLSQLGQMTLEQRAAPFCMKLSNVNGAPVGLACFSLVLYAILKVFTGCGRYYGYGVLLALGLLAEGFFYPQMLFGTSASIIAICLVMLIRRGGSMSVRVIITMAISGLCAVVLWPYLSSIGPGVRAAAAISTGWPLAAKLISYGLLSLALFVIIFVNRHYLGRGVDRIGLLVLSVVTAATLVTYIVLSLPSRNEYKALLLSIFVLGILGGVALTDMHKKWGKIAVVILTALLMLPSYSYTVSKLLKMADLPETWREEGRSFHVDDSQEDELYAWIRERTAKDSVFVDAELMIPAVAGRRLWVGPEKGTWQGTPGFGVDFLADICRYDKELLEGRKRVMAQILEAEHTAGIDTVRQVVGSGREVYVVARSKAAADKLQRDGYTGVFASRSGDFSVFVPGTF